MSGGARIDQPVGGGEPWVVYDPDAVSPENLDLLVFEAVRVLGAIDGLIAACPDISQPVARALLDAPAQQLRAALVRIGAIAPAGGVQ